MSRPGASVRDGSTSRMGWATTRRRREAQADRSAAPAVGEPRSVDDVAQIEQLRRDSEWSTRLVATELTDLGTRVDHSPQQPGQRLDEQDSPTCEAQPTDPPPHAQTLAERRPDGI